MEYRLGFSAGLLVYGFFLFCFLYSFVLGFIIEFVCFCFGFFVLVCFWDWVFVLLVGFGGVFLACCSFVFGWIWFFVFLVCVFCGGLGLFAVVLGFMVGVLCLSPLVWAFRGLVGFFWGGFVAFCFLRWGVLLCWVCRVFFAWWDSGFLVIVLVSRGY